MNKDQIAKLTNEFITNERLYLLISFTMCVTVVFFTNSPFFIKAIVFMMLIVGIFTSSLVMKLLAYTGVYQGMPIVFYFTEDNISFMKMNEDGTKSTIIAEPKQTVKLKLTRLSNIYMLDYKPAYLKDFKDPNMVYYTIFNIGFHYYKNGVKKWHEEPISPKFVPYYELTKKMPRLSSIITKMMSNTSFDNASIWVNKELAQIINIAPIENTKKLVDKATKQQYVKLYPVQITSIGDGYYNLIKKTSQEEQEKYNYANEITVGIHKDYVLKIDSHND